MLQRVGPKPWIEPEKLKSKADWIEAGRRVFVEADHVHLRTFDSEFIAQARDRKKLEELRVDTLPDGTLPDMRWVPTKEGVALTFPSCGTCHTAFCPDIPSVPGAPFPGPQRFRTAGVIVREPNQPAEMEFDLPTGTRYKAEVIDPWEMMITSLPGEHEGKFTLKLPGKPHQAIRFRKAR